MEPVMDIRIIRKILPHGYPFLLVDKVVSLDRGPDYPKNRAGGKITAIKNVTFNEEFFQGHFEHRPVMPGVLVIESMAQVSALLAFRPDGKPQDVAFASIREARFRRPVGPGDTLIIESQFIKDRGQTLVFECKAFVEDKLVAEAEIVAMMFDRVYDEPKLTV